MARRHKTTVLAFEAVSVEGALIAPAMLSRIAAQTAEGQKEADYQVKPGLTLREEISRYFRIGQAQFKAFRASDTPSPFATVKFVEDLLRDVFGFADLKRVGQRNVGDQVFAATLEALEGRAPVVVVPPSDPLDRASEHLLGDGRRRSAASAIQDWLNASDAALWGLCTNGVTLRLVRDNESLTRPAYIEADLRQMFEDEAFADFTILWLLIHASRFGAPSSPVTDCALERWRDAGAKEGVAARGRLREGFEDALLALGNGFLIDPQLRDRLTSGALQPTEYFGQLLHLAYRLIFLLVAEDRNLLHPPSASVSARRLYAGGYSVSSLRDRSVRRINWDAHQDRWHGLVVTFEALRRGEARLGLPALGGLFDAHHTNELAAAQLPNRALMEAIYRLAWLRDDKVLAPVNWRDMETEELGSVYEGLLELTPRLGADGRSFHFAEGAETKGNARKTSGSYYTPDSLVQALLDSALDPVLDRVEAEAHDPAEALLGVTVIDPACGSGHFLLSAASRIASRVARARAGGVASAEDYRHALRDVARRCIHGVDRNPMAVELAKVALWIETVEPGKPLGFLDANIRCGDALLGVFDMKVLAQGIPDEAYKPLTGDDKEAAKILLKDNRTQRDRPGDLAAGFTESEIAREAERVLALPEEDVEDIERKRQAYEGWRRGKAAARGWMAANLYVAAFLRTKRFRETGMARANVPDRVPTTLDVQAALAGRVPHPDTMAAAIDVASDARAFHWPLEFPRARAAGGFDVVVGNPPYLNAIELKRAGNDDVKVFWQCRYASATGAFDLYVLFLELAILLCSPRGRSAMLTPNKYLSAPYAEGLRELIAIRRALAEVVDVSRLASFEDASVYPVISTFEGQATRLVRARVDKGDNGNWFEHSWASLDIMPDRNWGVLLSSGAEVIGRALQVSVPMGQLFEVSASTTAAEADEYSPLIVEEGDAREAAGWKVVNTGLIDPFCSLWGLRPFRNNKHSFARPYLLDNKSIVSSRRRLQYSAPKLIFAKLAMGFEVVYDSDGSYAAMNVNFAFPVAGAGHFYAAQLNSRLLTWMYRQMFGALSMGGDYLQFQAPQLRAMPVVPYDESNIQHRRLSELGTYYASGEIGSLTEIDLIVEDMFRISNEEKARFLRRAPE